MTPLEERNLVWNLLELLIIKYGFKNDNEFLDPLDDDRIVFGNFISGHPMSFEGEFKEMVTAHTRVEGNVIISDLRGVDPIYSGNRFMIYSMYPEQNISVWIVNGKGGLGCSAAVGYSILNRTSDVNVGSLMLKYNGGGHKAVGTCQFSDENMETDLPKMIAELCEMSNK